MAISAATKLRAPGAQIANHSSNVGLRRASVRTQAAVLRNAIQVYSEHNGKDWDVKTERSGKGYVLKWNAKDVNYRFTKLLDAFNVPYTLTRKFGIFSPEHRLYLGTPPGRGEPVVAKHA